VVLLCAGCKVFIVSHNVGGVTTEGGSYDCPAGQSCEIDVADIFFRETFSGSPEHPNYRFKGWSAGDRHLCGGVEIACSLNTEKFAENPALMAILESDEPFFLIPEFERIGLVETANLEFREDGKPRVVDASGRLVGTLEIEPGSNFAKGVNVHFGGFAKHYIILIEHTGLGYRVSNPKNDLAYNNEYCEGESLPSLILSDTPSFGVFSPETAFPVIVGPESQIYIIDPVGRPSQSTWSHRWNSGERECLQGQSGSGQVGPLAPTDTELEYPLSIEGMIEIIDSPWPNSLVI